MTDERIDVVLKGCSTEPLSSYLKALGVFRLVVEQADADAKGYWKNGVFIIQSKLNEKELVNFFLTKYAPTPIISPWNNGCGFLKKKGKTTSLDNLLKSKDPRLNALHETIEKAREVVAAARVDGLPLDKLDKKDNASKIVKNRLIARLRATLPDDAVRWMDAVLVITSSEADWKGFPLLGSGGNDGNAEFSGLFIERIARIMVDNEKSKLQTETNKRNLSNALFGLQTNGIERNGIFGQFNPNAVGNFNASNGFISQSRANPWDYVLTMEGAIVFAGAAVRKYENKRNNTSMAFPFSVRASASGYGTAASGETVRSEMWLPTWGKPVSLAEIEVLFSEGRAEFGGRSAKNAIEFAQSVAALGIDRGLTAFHRYAFLKRNGKAFFAVKLDTFNAQGELNADLLREPIEWVFKSRRTEDAEVKKRALREIEENLFRLCHRGFEKPEPVLETIAAFGRLIKEAEKRKDSWSLKPRPILDAKWLEKADDGSAEFRLAASLTSLLINEFNVLIRSRNEKTKQKDDEKHIAKDVKKWLRFTGKPVRLLNIIMEDRILRLKQRGETTYSESTNVYPRLEDVNEFIEGRLDDKKIIDLTFGLIFLRWHNGEFRIKPKREPINRKSLFPGAGYALAKLCYTGVDFDMNKIWLVPAIHKRLVPSDGKKALELAVWRLRASGCRIPKYVGLSVPGGLCERIAAALLFPLGHRDINFLRDRILENVKEV